MTERTGRHLGKWLELDARKPDLVVVCFNPRHLEWVHEHLVDRVRAFSQELDSLGFAPPNDTGERQLGLLLATAFRDIRMYTRTTGGAMDSSLHKCGAAFDLWMGPTISGASQNDPSKTNYYPLYYTRDSATVWRIWGEVRVADIKASGSGKYATSLLAITPFNYDPTSLTGGGTAIKAEPGRKYLDISSVANFYGIFNIAPHPHGWKGAPEKTYTLSKTAPLFEEFMLRLDEQMFKENVNDTAVFIVNEGKGAGKEVPLKGLDMKREFGFLADWNKTFKANGPTPEALIDSPALLNELVRIAATYSRRRFIIRDASFALLHDDFLVPFTWKRTTPPSPPSKDPKDDPPPLPFRVEPKIPIPSDPKKWAAYETFKCPAFKGNPTHLEWWHMQFRKIGSRDLGVGAGVKWFDLVSELGITREIVEELYLPDVLTKRAG